MAKSNYGPGIPADQPATQGPGSVSHREKDFFAQPSLDRGIYVGFNDSAAEFAKKGDRRNLMTGGQPEGPKSFRVKGKR